MTAASGKPLQESVAWVAGVGAEAGLGAALARRFSKGGFTVALTGRTAGRLQTVADAIRADGGKAHAFAADVADEAQMRDVARRIAALGAVSAAVFNAATGTRAPTLELTVAQFTEAWRTTTLGAFVFAREAITLIDGNGTAIDASTGRGTLLFTGATGALRGKPPFAAFASAKAALRSLAQTLAREFGPQGIHVAHVVVDGGIDGQRLRTNSPQRISQAGEDGLLNIDAIAETYWQLHVQHRSAWTQEMDLRPFKEPF